MFKLSGKAQEMLMSAVNREKKPEDEQLFVRLTMGIG